MISNRQFGAVNSYADRRFIPICSIIVLARYVYASAWECQFSRRRFFWERLGTPGLSPACFFPGKTCPLPGLTPCSPCPLCEPLFLIFGTNTWVSRRRKEKGRLRRDAPAWECLPSPSPLRELALKFFIQAYFLCVLSVFSVFSVRARSFALNQAFFLCALCANLFWFLKNMLRGSAAPLREEALTPR